MSGMLHTLPPIKRRKGYTFILGRVRHRRKTTVEE